MTFSFMPDFVAKTHDPSVFDPKFESFTVPSLRDFTDGDRDEMLLCPVCATREYMRRTRGFRPQLPRLFLSTGRVRKMVFKNTISFWLREVIRRSYVSSLEDPYSLNPQYCSVGCFQAELCGGPGNEGGGLVPSDNVHLILPPGRDPPILGYLFLGPVVAAQQVLNPRTGHNSI